MPGAIGTIKLPERQIIGSSYKVFFAGINTLEQAGIPPSHVRAYMLIGFDKNETWDRIWYRFKLMVERDIEPYPMVFHQRGQKPRVDLKCFQRWVNLGLYRFVPWNEYRRQTKSDESVAAWYRLYANKRITSGNHLIETIKAHDYSIPTDPRDQHKQSDDDHPQPVFL